MPGSDLPPLHPAAARGFSAQAGTYAGARPDYPAASLDWLRDTLGLGPSEVALEVGAGTGKFTARLVETGARVIAVEPLEKMRELLVATCPKVEALEGQAESLPVADQSVDAVVCAQAFHWFANNATVAEFHRVLKPGGQVGLIRNARDLSVGWVQDLCNLWREQRQDVPDFDPEKADKLFATAGFAPARLATCKHAHYGPIDQVVVKRTLSMSFVGAMPTDQQAKLLERVRHLAATHPDLVGKDNIAFPHKTEMYSYERPATPQA